MNSAVEDILKLSVKERMEAVEKIWDSILEENPAEENLVEEEANSTIPEWHLEIIRERLKQGNLRSEAKSWDEIKSKYGI